MATTSPWAAMLSGSETCEESQHYRSARPMRFAPQGTRPRQAVQTCPRDAGRVEHAMSRRCTRGFIILDDGQGWSHKRGAAYGPFVRGAPSRTRMMRQHTRFEAFRSEVRPRIGMCLLAVDAPPLRLVIAGVRTGDRRSGRMASSCDLARGTAPWLVTASAGLVIRLKYKTRQHC